MAGANQSANQAQTKAQIKFPMTSPHLLAVTFGGANHRANQIGCQPRLNRAMLAAFPWVTALGENKGDARTRTVYLIAFASAWAFAALDQGYCHGSVSSPASTGLRSCAYG